MWILYWGHSCLQVWEKTWSPRMEGQIQCVLKAMKKGSLGYVDAWSKQVDLHCPGKTQCWQKISSVPLAKDPAGNKAQNRDTPCSLSSSSHLLKFYKEKTAIENRLYLWLCRKKPRPHRTIHGQCWRRHSIKWSQENKYMTKRSTFVF